jgi:hypothetical protein
LARRNAGDVSLYYRADKKLWVAQYEGVYRYSKDKDKAKATLRQLLNQVEITKPENITVSTLLDQYLEYATPNLKFASVKRYREVIRLYIKPALGTAKTSELTAYQVQQQYSKWIAADISPNVIYMAHTVLSGAFKRGAKWQLVRSNIIRDVDAPKVERKEIEVTTRRGKAHPRTNLYKPVRSRVYPRTVAKDARRRNLLTTASGLRRRNRHPCYP